MEAKMANALRALSIDAVQKANSGHPGMPMGMADVATILFNRFINIDPSNPNWEDRDRFILSAGHGSMLLYSINYLLGYEDMTLEELKNFRQLSSKTAGHPEYGHAFGIETTTGPLGQGLANSVGMAIAEKMLCVRFSENIVNHYTYVIAGDGCLQEGISHEAIELAGHLGLNKLIVFWDDNNISIDGPTSLSTSSNQLMRFEAAGWDVHATNGHELEDIAIAIDKAKNSNKPSLIACKTIIGFGSPNVSGTEKAHGSPLGEEEVAATRKKLDWNYPPFDIPDDIVSKWRDIAIKGQAARKSWERRLDNSNAKGEFLQFIHKQLANSLWEEISKFKKNTLSKNVNVATRKASEMVLDVINQGTKITIGGSADLTHSNLTITKSMTRIQKKDFSGRYIHYGIREHGMAAAMNGIAVHGGFIPYGGTFLIFSDYARGAIRLSALMKQQVIYIMTHDSIGLGEDGPTHQPIEHLAMLRATPNLNVFRPADVIEVAECWEIALKSYKTPSVLALSRQSLPQIRKAYKTNLSMRGAYILSKGTGKRDITLVATGSEVAIALEASKKILNKNNKNAYVISMPSWELFQEQDENYQLEILGDVPKIAIEAASSLGWERWIGQDGKFVGMHSFGASAPQNDLYKHFGITTDAIVKAAQRYFDKTIKSGSSNKTNSSCFFEPRQVFSLKYFY